MLRVGSAPGRRVWRRTALARPAASLATLAAAAAADLAAPLPYPIAALYAIPMLLAASGAASTATLVAAAGLGLFVAAGVAQRFEPSLLAV